MKIAFDLTLMQPGCVLVQAAMGCEPSIAHHFNIDDWLLSPTPGMRVYPIGESQIDILVEKVKQRDRSKFRES